MTKTWFPYSLILFCLFIYSCKEEAQYRPSVEWVERKQEVNWNATRQYYLNSIDSTIVLLEQLEKPDLKENDARKIFITVRREFKKAEPYAAYLNPAVGKLVNGAALPVFKEDNRQILPPIGLQKIEETIFEGNISNTQFTSEVEVTKGYLKILREGILERELNPGRFFTATHQQLLGILSLSISGFDTPVSQQGIKEVFTSLESLVEVYNLSIRKIILQKDSSLDKAFLKKIEAAQEMVNKNQDFESFDRFTFIKDHINPITLDWVKIRQRSGLFEDPGNKPFNMDTPSFFEEDSFNIDYFLPAVNRSNSNEKIALGKILFNEEKLSANRTMSCATCHIPGKAFQDNRRFSLDNRGNDLERNTPTLIYSVLQKNFFWDGRADDLENQISLVFTEEKEFNTQIHSFSANFLEEPRYQELFEQAFKTSSFGRKEIIDAISLYIASLNSFNSRFDRNMRGEEDTFTKEEKLGFNVFMGKALCATCHFIPLTNGTVPPFYLESEKEVIGVPATVKNLELDEDNGAYWIYKVAIHKGAFKTPTLRNIEVTAPYMHNGVYNTLEEVIDFYDSGGGAGLGFDMPFQTLPADSLNLTEEEKRALVAYLKTLTDTGEFK